MQNMIVMWSGDIGSIPQGWALCDGNSGTPDLRDRFVIGAGSTYNPGDTGGAVNHTHEFTLPYHTHSFQAGGNMASGAGYDETTSPATVSGTSDPTDHLPPYYALAFIMKL